MTIIGEEIPICYCDLDYDRSGIEETRAREARDAAVDTFYNGRHIQPSKVEPALVEQGFTVTEAHCAVDGCLFKLMRRTCGTGELVPDPNRPGKQMLRKKVKLEE